MPSMTLSGTEFAHQAQHTLSCSVNNMEQCGMYLFIYDKIDKKAWIRPNIHITM